MTRLRRIAGLAWSNLAADRASGLLSAAGIAVGIACLVFFVGLGRGVGGVVRRIFPEDARTLEVVPSQVSLGFLGGGSLDEAALARLAGLPGVARAHPKMVVRVPAIARYRGEFFGAPLHIALEVMAVGVEPALVSSDVAAGRSFADPGSGQPIPALAATRLLEIYNKSFATQRKLPRLTPERLTGFTFPIEVGRSFVTPSGDVPVRAMSLALVGFSDRAFLAGVTIPLDTARRLNREFGQDAERYSSVVLEAARSDDVPAIAEAVRRAGFEIDDTERRLAEQVGTAVAVMAGALSLLSALITALAAMNIAHALFASVRERRREIGVLRSVGATRGDIMALIVTEASIIGVAGGVAGAALGWSVATGVDLAATRLVAELPFKPESFFQFDAGLLALGAGVAVLASALGAIAPARAAANLDPARALAE